MSGNMIFSTLRGIKIYKEKNVSMLYDYEIRSILNENHIKHIEKRWGQKLVDQSAIP